MSKEGNALARRRESESPGFKSLYWQRFFSYEVSVGVSLFNNIIVEFCSVFKFVLYHGSIVSIVNICGALKWAVVVAQLVER